MLLFAALSHLLEPAVAYMPELSRINKQEAKIMHFYKYLDTIPEEKGYKYGAILASKEKSGSCNYFKG